MAFRKRLLRPYLVAPHSVSGSRRDRSRACRPASTDNSPLPSRSKAGLYAAGSCEWATPSTPSFRPTIHPAEPVAALLGEACAPPVGSVLKFEGFSDARWLQGDGPVRCRRHDYDTDVGCCRFDADEWPPPRRFHRLGQQPRFWPGVFVMTLDRGPDFERTQVPIEGEPSPGRQNII
jgi:hypothetical protein